jgi:fatty-acyl-CoA synthase
MTYTKKSYYHRGGTEPLLGATIPEHLATIVNQFPQQLAVISKPQNRRLNYQQFALEVDLVARAICAMGYSKGDRIGVWSTNNIEWVLLQMATARIGVVLVNINPAYRTRELAYALQRSEAQGLFVIPNFRSSNYIEMLVTLIPELKQVQHEKLDTKDFPALRHVVVYEPNNPAQTTCDYPDFMTWQRVMSGASSVNIETINEITAALDRDDPINIQYMHHIGVRSFIKTNQT